MPTTKSDLYEIQDDRTFIARIDDKRRLEGSLQFADAVVTLAGDEVATNVITLCELPPGAIIYPEHSLFYTETDAGTTLTVDVGDSVDPDRYADGSDIAALGAVNFITAAVPDGAKNRHELTSTTRTVTLTVATAASLSAGAKVHVKLAYKSL